MYIFRSNDGIYPNTIIMISISNIIRIMNHTASGTSVRQKTGKYVICPSNDGSFKSSLSLSCSSAFWPSELRVALACSAGGKCVVADMMNFAELIERWPASRRGRI